MNASICAYLFKANTIFPVKTTDELMCQEKKKSLITFPIPHNMVTNNERVMFSRETHLHSPSSRTCQDYMPCLFLNLLMISCSNTSFCSSATQSGLRPFVLLFFKQIRHKRKQEQLGLYLYTLCKFLSERHFKKALYEEK